MIHERLLRFDEAASILGLKISTLRAWRLCAKIPVVRVGARSVRIPESAVRRIIEEGQTPARARRTR
jgi:excisionase family DNA binding protein